MRGNCHGSGAHSKPVDFDSDACFEPHRDVIDDAAQVAIYETVLGDTDNHVTHVLLHANSYLKDNRIPPRGFTDSRASGIEPQTLPAGVDHDSDSNYMDGQQGSGSDTVHYRITLDDEPAGLYSVEARLLYQAVAPAFVKVMKSDGSRVSQFRQMYTEHPPAVEALSIASATVLAADNSDDDSDSDDNGTDSDSANDGSSSGSGGGCTLDPNRTGSGISLPLLVVATLITLEFRRRQRKPKGA